MNRRLLCLLCVPALGCSGVRAVVPDTGTLPPMHPYYLPADQVQYENTAQGHGQPYWARPGNQGRDFCKDVEDSGRALVKNNMSLGWGFGIGSAVALGTGTVLAAGQYDNSPGYRIVSAGLPLVGAALGYVALAYLSRAQDAQVLAGSAANAVTMPDDRAANEACNAAIARWSSTKADAAVDSSRTPADRTVAPSNNAAPAPGSPAPSSAAPAPTSVGPESTGMSAAPSDAPVEPPHSIHRRVVILPSQSGESSSAQSQGSGTAATPASPSTAAPAPATPAPAKDPETPPIPGGSAQ